jgi:hypothetical protein
VHTLWVPPKKDPDFKRALEAHRVMTLEQTPGGGKADFGTIGFDEKHETGQFLIFPKSLRSFEGSRVIGVKFDLIEQPKLAPADLPKRRAPPARAKPRKRSVQPAAATPPRQSPVASPHPKPAPPPAEKPSPAHARLIREVRVAMKDLEHGQYVAAHQRLERALR